MARRKTRAKTIETLIKYLENGEEILDEEYDFLIWEEAYDVKEVDEFANVSSGYGNWDTYDAVQDTTKVYEYNGKYGHRYIAVNFTVGSKYPPIEYYSMKLVKPIIVEKTEWVDETA